MNAFTTVDLGCERGNNMTNIVTRLENPASSEFLRTFNEIWNDSDKLTDVTNEVIEMISTVYQEKSPELIYFMTRYNIFSEFVEDMSEDVLPNEATGFKDSVIWNKLYNFQKDAALAIISKLEQYNGCILADSVGLGKTFTALSVIKYYENRNKSVLVLCPKKLYDNWSTFKTNYKNNPLVADRLRYDILFHSDLSRERGMSAGIDVARINWGNYDLIVIDESHNFRNGGNVDDEELDDDIEQGEPRKENRYQKLMKKVIRVGVKTKVLMLSATPVNNRFNDLKNQLQLAYEGKSEYINDALDTDKDIDQIFREAQQAYSRWTKLQPTDSTTERLLDSLNFEFFKILDAVTIARSRKHIEKYYDTTKIGAFPERLKPIARRPGITDLDSSVTFSTIFDLLQQLKLVVYSPSAYILPSRLYKYEQEDDKTISGGKKLSLVNRERGIRVLMHVQLLKRLESSVHSFELSLGHLQKLIGGALNMLKDSKGVFEGANMDGFGLEEDEITVGNENNRINLEDLDYKSWQRDLELDNHVITKLIEMVSKVTPEHDSKLKQLLADIDNKIANPINEDNKKVIVFSAFSDTAVYLYEHVAEHVLKMHGLHTALISGDVDGRSTLKIKQKMDFNTVLTLFSPISKEKAVIYPNIKENIDILIATDCISEGQNLQDCDYLVNYDIHWNPVRIIQRFGRVDRKI